ncbi:MAG: Na+/H+ antiporter subunit E [Chromatiales bacterium]|nr:Na+/H+ antiporter subunit E [Chromatiales bacterium]
MWWLLSGKTESLLLGLGLASCLLVVWLSLRMKLMDEEGFPVYVNLIGLAKYVVWLAAEVVKANVDVTKRVLGPSSGIDPVIFNVSARQRTVVGRVIYANSITLTPGTVSVDLDDEVIEVHALSGSGADDLMASGMGERVCGLEGDNV